MHLDDLMKPSLLMKTNCRYAITENGAYHGGTTRYKHAYTIRSTDSILGDNSVLWYTLVIYTYTFLFVYAPTKSVLD